MRSKITVIAQDPTLFTGTLKFNLDPFNEYEPSAIEELLIKAGLSDLISREPEDSGANNSKSTSKKQQTGNDDQTGAAAIADAEQEHTELTSQRIEDVNEREKARQGRGIYMKIAEGGSNLSTGEKQLICICRAILRKNKVVVLDEATANIDLVTEEKIQRLIEEQFRESTVVTIAHRLNTIIKSDRVLVLSHGLVEEYDAPRVLMSNPESNFSKLLKELKKEEEEKNEA